MKNLVQKLKNKKGFTLMEMLIVVAIMVILVAVSIPVFTNQLNNAKKATDEANERAAKSMMLTAYMTGDITAASGATTIVRYYDADNGVLDTDKPDGYGQGGIAVGTGDNKDKVIKITLTIETGAVAITWE